MFHILSIEQIGALTPLLQLVLIAVLFAVTTLDQFAQYKNSGRMWTYYPVMPTLLLAPIYEEVIFRGFLLTTFVHLYSIPTAIMFTSGLFGVWHLKNLFFVPSRQVLHQIVYTGCVVSPLLAFVTIITGTIWVPVILHYIHNLIVSHFPKAELVE